MCRFHGGGAPQVKLKALERLKAMQPQALTTLEGLLTRSEFPTVQLAAVKDVLDRTEGKAMERVQADVDGSLQITWIGMTREKPNENGVLPPAGNAPVLEAELPEREST